MSRHAVFVKTERVLPQGRGLEGLVGHSGLFFIEMLRQWALARR